MNFNNSRKFKLRNPKGAIALLAFFLCWAIAGAGSKSLEKVTLQLKWTHAFQFAGYYAALENGYYRDAGLDVEILAGGPYMDVVTQVVSGLADFGVGTSGLLLDYAAGKPIKVLGVVYQHSPMALIMRADKPTDTVQDLRGETVMVEHHAADLLAMFKRLGLPLDSMNCVDHTGRTEDLIKYDAYAVTAYLTNEPFVLDQLGVKYFMFSPRAYGIDFYGDNFFTSRRLFQQNEALVQAFCAATVRGWQDAIANPEVVIDLILEKYPTEMSRDHLRYEAERTIDLMTNLVTPGYMLRGRWEHIADTYIELGMLKERPDLDDFLLLPDSSDLPPWFMEAVLGVELLFFVMLAILLSQRNRNLELQQRVAKQSVQKEQREREEVLKRVDLQRVLVRDIHDGLGGIAANISLTAFLARKEKDISSKDEWLDKLEHLALEINMEVRELKNSLEESTLQWSDLIDAVRRRSNLLFDGKNTVVDFKVEGEPVEEDIGLVEGLSLIRIAGEGMNNALKYSGADQVRIVMAASPESFQISVIDNGCGFDPQTVRRGRGLNNMEQRTDELGGRFDLSNDHGTSLKISIPRPIRIVKDALSPKESRV